MTRIAFDQPTRFSSLGRNGHIKTHGIEVTDMGNGEWAEIQIVPVTSRGKPTESCRLSIRKDALPALIDVLAATLLQGKAR
jgi:hypothetical protein